MELGQIKIKKWGSSLGIIIPKEIIKRENLKQNQSIRILAVETKSKTKVKDIFGKLKFKKSTKKILDEVDRDLEPELFEDN